MNQQAKSQQRGLLGRLAQGSIVCAEGYLFELERRGYLQAGSFVPEAVLEHPEIVAQVHRDFVRAGSDVVEAFTYYGHREKLRLIGKEQLLEPLNQAALEIAQSVAGEFESDRPLVAGNVCNTNVYHSDAQASASVRRMFEEQIAWAARSGVDFVIGETFYYLGEARLALEAVKAAGLHSVITLALPASGQLADGFTVADAAAVLEQDGVDVVGLNCFRGPKTMLPFLREIRGRVSCHVAGLPVPYRTTEQHPTFFTLSDPNGNVVPNGRFFPTALDSFHCNRYEMARFAEEAKELDVRYVGICCGNTPAHTRALAEALGRHPEASRYSPDMSKHFAFGTDPSLDKETLDLAPKL
jgi:betaine-homocysteine S-methyltransferase